MENDGLLANTKNLHGSNTELADCFNKIGLGFQKLAATYDSLEKSLGSMPAHENPILIENKKIVTGGIRRSKKFLRQSETRVGYRIVQDIKRFSQRWNEIKKHTETFYGNSLKSRLKNLAGTKKLTGQGRLEKKNNLKKGMRESLGDFNSILEDYVHSMVYMHSQSLQIWSQVYSEVKRDVRRKNTKEADYNDDEEEDLYQ